MFASLTKRAFFAAFAVGMALAGSVVTPADAAVRHNAGGVHSAGIQRGNLHGENCGYAGRNDRGHGGGYGGYGGNGYGYGYGNGFGYSCPSFPLALVAGRCF